MKRTKVSKRDRQLVLGDAPTCRYCGYAGKPSEFDVDHVLPVSKGGRNEISNYAAACSACNRSRGNRDDQARWTFRSRYIRMSEAEKFELMRETMARARLTVRAA